MIKLNAATRKMTTGIAGMAVMGWALVMSAYSIYFVLTHLGVPNFFAFGGSIAYDGGAIFSAAKSLQAAQEGRSGLVARLWMVVFVALSSFCNALHPILGHESPLSIPYWAGLPIGAAGMFEIHTSQARFKAQARMGKRYPAPLPSFGGVRWALFPLDTLNKLRDYSFSQGDALMGGNSVLPRKILKARRKAELAEYSVSTATEQPSVTTGTMPATSLTLRGDATEQYPLPATEPGATSGTPGSATSGPRPSDPGPRTERPAASPEGATVTKEPATGPVTVGATPVSDTGATVTVLPSGEKRYVRYCANPKCGREFHASRPEAKCCGSNCRVALTRARKADAS